MGTPKALLQLEGRTFLDRLMRLFAEVCDPVVVVLGSHASQIRAGIDPPPGVVFTENPDPDRGMLSSLQCGIDALPAPDSPLLFMPVDHPNLRLSTLQSVAAAFHLGGARVVVPTYEGAHGHPVCVDSTLVSELRALPAEARASDVIHRYTGETLYVEVDDPAVTTDIDDPAAYAELLSGGPAASGLS